MREYYIFATYPGNRSWRMLETIWLFKQDAINAMNYEASQNPDCEYVIGYSEDGKPIVIPDTIDKV